MLAVRHVSSQDCETLGSEIRVNKFLNVEHHGRQMNVRCGVRLSLNKCEGTCWSYESPSVIDPRGFRKKCNCCRERELVDRSVVLDECYDVVSGLIVPGLHPVIVIKEPMNCECRECANFIWAEYSAHLSMRRILPERGQLSLCIGYKLKMPRAWCSTHQPDESK